jgi:hypothetical protein
MAEGPRHLPTSRPSQSVTVSDGLSPGLERRCGMSACPVSDSGSPICWSRAGFTTRLRRHWFKAPKLEGRRCDRTNFLNAFEKCCMFYNNYQRGDKCSRPYAIFNERFLRVNLVGFFNLHTDKINQCQLIFPYINISFGTWANFFRPTTLVPIFLNRCAVIIL